MHSAAFFFSAALLAAAGINAEPTSTTHSSTTTTLTRTVEQVVATTTATGNAPPEYYVAAASSPAGTLSAMPYGYGNGTSVAPSGTAASSGGVPSQSHVYPVPTGAAAGLVSVDAIAVAALAGAVGFAFV